MAAGIWKHRTGRCLTNIERLSRSIWKWNLEDVQGVVVPKNQEHSFRHVYYEFVKPVLSTLHKTWSCADVALDADTVAADRIDRLYAVQQTKSNCMRAINTTSIEVK